MAENLINELVENYMGKLFYFCLKRTGNSYEAENLTSDILLNILSALNSGIIPNNFSAWVWQIARNRYSVWADKKHNRTEWITGSDIGDYEIEDENTKIEDKLIQSENLSLLRRELAFISSDYRNIIVSYYIEDRKIKDIAASLNLPEGTVKSSLFRARKILKEGMNMAREFGVRSYKPEDVSFAASGAQPSGLPWSAVQRKLPKNILLEADNNPSTVEELAIALGTAVPYMEEEAELLVRATLLKKIGNKYITDFFIASKECQLEMYNAQRESSKEISALIDAIASETIDSIRSLGIVHNDMSDSELKWCVVIYAIDFLIESLNAYNIDWPSKRANGEEWGFMGFEKVELPEKCVMGHNGNGDKDMFWTYKISDYGLWNRVGEMKYEETLFLADVIKKKRNISSFTETESRLWESIKNRFAHEGEDGSIIPDILVVTHDKLLKIKEILKAHPLSGKLLEKLAEVFDETLQILRKSSNPILNEQLVYCASMQILQIRMMVVHDEVEEGRLIVPDDPEHSTIAMWLELAL